VNQSFNQGFRERLRRNDSVSNINGGNRVFSGAKQSEKRSNCEKRDESEKP
jgi:hypothetical protein